MDRIRKHRPYRQLGSFQTATIIYDATVWFCKKFVDSRSRTVDQMVQAARSGRQNIAEGTRTGRTSSQSELRLISVARASLEELLLDYEDFLRHPKQKQWGKDDPRAQAVRLVVQDNQKGFRQLDDGARAMLYVQWLESDDASERANALICLIHQANFLLDKQIEALEQEFVEQGGYREQLAARRIDYRKESATGDSELPPCPRCGKTMVVRSAQSGGSSGQTFLGCSTYPNCKGTREL